MNVNPSIVFFWANLFCIMFVSCDSHTLDSQALQGFKGICRFFVKSLSKWLEVNITLKHRYSKGYIYREEVCLLLNAAIKKGAVMLTNWTICRALFLIMLIILRLAPYAVILS
jgi:hypothetical protein